MNTPSRWDTLAHAHARASTPFRGCLFVFFFFVGELLHSRESCNGPSTSTCLAYMPYVLRMKKKKTGHFPCKTTKMNYSGSDDRKSLIDYTRSPVASENWHFSIVNRRRTYTYFNTRIFIARRKRFFFFSLFYTPFFCIFFYSHETQRYAKWVFFFFFIAFKCFIHFFFCHFYVYNPSGTGLRNKHFFFFLIPSRIVDGTSIYRSSTIYHRLRQSLGYHQRS